VDATFRRYVCRACGVIYDEAKGDADSGIAAGTRFEDIPGDWRCPVCGVGKDDFVLLAAPPARTQAPGTGRLPRGTGIVIVGAGTAGWAVARALRARDPAVPVTLVSACPGHAYHKPLLSVSLAKGKAAAELVEATGEARARELGVRLVADAVVLRIDRLHRRVVTTKGTLAYADLVLAYGARPRRLPLGGDAAGEVIAVNDLAGYGDLVARAGGGKTIAIVGAGLVGCELAENLAEAGARVLLLDAAKAPLAGQIPEAAALALASRLALLGVRTRFGAKAASLDRAGGALALVLEDGTTERVDAVVGAIGLEVDSRLPDRAGLGAVGGIGVHPATMRAGDEHVFAVGECACVGGRRFGFIEPILEQAETCAAALCGQEAAFVPRAPLVRLKTPAFPVAWGSALADQPGVPWCLREGDEDGFHYERRVGDTLLAFAVAGRFVDRATELHRRLAA
jgi:rubredoxin-NAD+ reductase